MQGRRWRGLGEGGMEAKKKDQFVQRPYDGKWTAEKEVEGN